MNAFLGLGRWFFALPLALIGLLHFMDTSAMADNVVPAYLPAKEVWVYLAGAALIAASVSLVLGKYDKLAATLLAAFLIILAILVHVPKAMSGGLAAQSALTSLLKDAIIAGGAMMYALHYAKDRSVIG